MPFGYLILEKERNPRVEWIGANGTVHSGPVAYFECTKGERWLEIVVSSDADSSVATVQLGLGRPETDEKNGDSHCDKAVKPVTAKNKSAKCGQIRAYIYFNHLR